MEKKNKENIVYYKGFNSSLKCRGFQYKEGEVYEMPENEIKMCYKGFHFCFRLIDTFHYYNKSKHNKYCYAIVEPLGKIEKRSDKGVTNKLKIVKILDYDEVDRVTELEQIEEDKNEIWALDIVRKFQEKYEMSIGGSVALKLHGLTLDRNKNGSTDFDIVMPYYQKLDFKDDNLIDEIEEFDGKSSGNDFDKTYVVTTIDGRFIKMDVRIKPEQSYDIVKFDDFDYKVSDLMTILEAKCRYAMDGNKKHFDDIKSLLNYDKDESKD